MRLNLWLLELSQAPEFFRHLDVIAAMGGRAAGAARYFSTIEQAYSVLDPADPLWFVPVGVVEPGRVVGIDARPELLAAGQVHVLERFGRGELVATAASPAEHLRLHLAQAAIRLRLGGDRAQFAAERALAEGITGAPLWPPGALDGADDVFSWLWSQGDRAPYTASMLPEEDPAKILEILDVAMEKWPATAFLGYVAAAKALKIEAMDRHAEYTTLAARSPLWTRFQVSLRDIDIDVRFTREDRPELLSEAEAALLCKPEKPSWLAAVDAAKAAGDGLHAARLAVDAGHLFGLDDALINGVFRPIFTELGWSQALRLCDFRQGKTA